jgi:hypothetical protein
MQSVPITTDVVSSNLEQGEVCNILWSSLSVTCDGRWFSLGPTVLSSNKTDRHNIAEILLKVEFNTIKQKNKLHVVLYIKMKIHVCFKNNKKS